MNTDEASEYTSETFGDYLKRHREASGKTVDAIAKSTRISKSYLVAFEESDFARFPPEAFARGFLRTYAQEIGVDPDEIVQRFESFRRATAVTQIRDFKKPSSAMPSTKTPWLVWSGLGVLLFVGLFILLIPSDPAPESQGTSEAQGTTSSSETANPEGQASVTLATPSTSAGSALVIPPPPSQLSITAVSSGKISVRVDDQPSEELSFSSGEVRNLSVYREVEIRNIPRGGFKFLYNGKPLEMTGPVLKLFNRNLMQP